MSEGNDDLLQPDDNVTLEDDYERASVLIRNAGPDGGVRGLVRSKTWSNIEGRRSGDIQRNGVDNPDNYGNYGANINPASASFLDGVDTSGDIRRSGVDNPGNYWNYDANINPPSPSLLDGVNTSGDIRRSGVDNPGNYWSYDANINPPLPSFLDGVNTSGDMRRSGVDKPGNYWNYNANRYPSSPSFLDGVNTSDDIRRSGVDNPGNYGNYDANINSPSPSYFDGGNNRGGFSRDVSTISTTSEKRWKRSIETLLMFIEKEKCRPYSIPIVSDKFRKQNENAYMPNIVSIGPLCKGARKDLLQMEETKWHYTLKLLRTTKNAQETLTECSNVILKLDEVVRTYYVDEIKLHRYDLAKIMLFDGCFLLYLLFYGPDKLKIHHSSRGSGVEVTEWDIVLSDLTVLENQIPFVVLRKLDETVHAVRDKDLRRFHGTVNEAALSLLGYPAESNHGTDENAAHFVELLHQFLVREGQREENQERPLQSHNTQSQGVAHVSMRTLVSTMTKESKDDGQNIEPKLPTEQSHVELKRCATWLQAAGVTIKPTTSESQVNFKKAFSFRENKGRTFTAVTRLNIGMRFKNKILEIAPLHMTGTTEAKWRNLIAWEHYKWSISSASEQGTTGFSCKCTSSALVFSDLICCADDVQLLKDKEVVVDHLHMSNQDLLAFFRSITMGVDRLIIDPSYRKMIYDLNTHRAANFVSLMLPWHYRKRIPELLYPLYEFLKRDYNFVATFVLLLTVVQTFYAAFSYHHQRK